MNENLKTMFSSKAAKALVAGALAAIAIAIPSITDNGLAPVEWLEILGAFLATWQATYWIPNAGDHPADDYEPKHAPDPEAA